MTPKISFVIGSFNRRQFLAATLESIREDAKGYQWEAIVVDGGSTDGAVEYLASQKDIITIVQHNRGTWRGKPLPRRSWGYFINLGFRCAQGRIVCMLSDDCLIIPGSIRSALQTYEFACQVGRKVGGVAFYFRDWPHEKRYKVHRSFGRRLVINHGFYTKEALLAVGYADEDNYGFYCADGDLSLRIWESGYEILDCPNALVEHHAHAPERSSHSSKEQYRKDVAYSRKRWQQLISNGGGFESDWPTIAFVDLHDTAARFPSSGTLAQTRWKAFKRMMTLARKLLMRMTIRDRAAITPGASPTRNHDA